MDFNMMVIVGAAFIPTLIGFIWYHPKVFGNIWMKAAGLSEENLKGGNMLLIFGLSLVLSFMAAFILSGIVIHQMSVMSLMMPEKGIAIAGSEDDMKMLMDKYGKSFRTFEHGVIHGAIITIFLVLPIMATGAMFERKGFKYIAVNVGYWLVALMLMGGVICKWA